MKLLSWAARGLLAYIAGQPPEWRLTISELRKASPCTGRDGIYSLLDELIEAGCLVRKQDRVAGRMSAVRYSLGRLPDSMLKEAAGILRSPTVEG